MIDYYDLSLNTMNVTAQIIMRKGLFFAKVASSNNLSINYSSFSIKLLFYTYSISISTNSSRASILISTGASYSQSPSTVGRG